MSAGAWIGIGYAVVATVYAGVMHGLKGWDEPWLIFAFFWPIALPFMAVYHATRRVKERRKERERQQEIERREQERLLREAGIEP